MPGGSTSADFAELVARAIDVDGPTERGRALCSAFWDFLEGIIDRERAIDAIEASGFDV